MSTSHRLARVATWMALAIFAMPLLAQDPPPAEQPAATPADATPPADSTDASIAAPPEGAPDESQPPADTRALDESVQEEELLFPANTQVAVFVSMDIGEFFALDSLTLKIDNKEVANYLYTPREAEALLKGGVHRVYLGNLKVGEHQLVAF